MNPHDELWQKILIELEKKYDEESFKDLFEPLTSITRFSNGLAILVVASDYIKNRINRMYAEPINELAKRLADFPIRFKFMTKDELAKEEILNTKLTTSTQNVNFNGTLNANYSFDNFIVGPSNQYAQRVALMTAKQPGTVNNPLYIFGDVGLGKTHLMHAIGNFILDHNVNMRVLYIPATTFIDDFVSIVNKTASQTLQEKYENLDVLLIDDIQLMSKANATQNQFFKVFNHLKDSGKQIVITSDRPASELKDFGQRLITRFESGLTVDVSIPDYQHMKKILIRKISSQSDNENIPEDVIDYIVSNFSTNIRSLEGALHNVLMRSLTFNCDIDLNLAKEALAPLLKTKAISNSLNENNYDRVMSVTADFYGISVDDLIGKSRKSDFTIPRHICMYLIKYLYKQSYKTIGKLFGDRDHSTVLVACEKIESQIQFDNKLKKAVDNLSKKVSTP